MGNVITETRDLSGFDRISLGGVGHLVVEPGDQESFKVEAESDLLPYIITRVRDGRLEIGLKHRISRPLLGSTGPINYYVTVKELNGIEVSGAGKVTGSRLCADHMDLFISGAGKAKLDMTVTELDTNISGAGSLRLAGEAVRQALNISGAGKYLASELSSKEGSVVISGTGKSTMNVSDRLDVKISGCGHVTYAGNPEISKRVSGCGKVSKIA
jgi:hypothetical protein